jgi:hypothetical protein
MARTIANIQLGLPVRTVGNVTVIHFLPPAEMVTVSLTKKDAQERLARMQIDTDPV